MPRLSRRTRRTVLLSLTVAALVGAMATAASAVTPPPGGWPGLPAAATPGPSSPGAHIQVSVRGLSVANPGQPWSLVATMANTGDVALQAPTLSPVAGQCFSGDVATTGLYELVGNGDSQFDPGEIRARQCRGYAPFPLGPSTEDFQGSARDGVTPVTDTAGLTYDVISAPATPATPVGGWPAAPSPPPAPSTSPGTSLDVQIVGPPSVIAGAPVTVLGTIANTGTTNLYPTEFSATSGPCTDTTQSSLGQFYEIHGDGDGINVLEPGEMFGATCSGYALPAFAAGGALRGRAAPLGGGSLEDSAFLAIPILPSTSPDMTATINAPATITPGQPLTATAVLENTGTASLALTSIVPDAACPGTVGGPTDNPGNNNGIFEPGEKVEVTCTFTPDGSVDPIAFGVTATAAIAPADGGGTLTRHATASTDVLVDSRIHIETLNPPHTGIAGAPVTMTAEVTNPGNTALTVQSIITAPVQCPPVLRQVITGDGDLLLEPGEVWHYDCTVNAPTTTDPFTATTTIRALDPANRLVQDTFSFLFDPLTDGTGGTSVDVVPPTVIGNGGTATTNIDVTPSDPIGTQVTSPFGTTISIVETTVLTNTSAGFLGYQVDVHLDPGTPGSSALNPLPANNPLRVVFYIDQSIFHNGGQIYRDGVPIPEPGTCTTPGVASPEPCIESRVLTPSGDLKLTVLAVHSSSWNFVANATAEVPVVTITSPADGASYPQGSVVNADFACTANELLSCTGDVAPGAAVPTGVAGPHSFAVTATVPGGSGTLTVSYTVTAPPGAPTGVFGTPRDQAATVSWSAPANSGYPAISGYTVTASPGGRTCTTSAALTCDVTGLTNGTAYTFTVAARNTSGAGPSSTASAPVTPQGAAANPVLSTPGMQRFANFDQNPVPTGASPVTTTGPGAFTYRWGNNGSLSAAAAWAQPGANGSGHSVTQAGSCSANVYTTGVPSSLTDWFYFWTAPSWTWELWVKPNATIPSGAFKRLIESQANGSFWGVDLTNLTAASGQLRFISSDYSGARSATTGAIASLKSGVWAHIAFTMNGGSGMKVFVNGAQAAGPVGWLTTGSGSDMRFGSSWASSSMCLNASFDNVAAYNRVLTLAEIQNHYANP